MARRRVRMKRGAGRNVREELNSLLEVGLVEECGSDAKGEPLYGMTDWARQFAFVEIAALMTEQGMPMEARPPMEDYLAALVKDLVIIMPLLKMPDDAEGVCDLAVVYRGEIWGGLNVVYRTGELVDHGFGLAAEPRARIMGSFHAFCLTLLRSRLEGLVVEGEHSFGRDLIDAMIAESNGDPESFKSW